MDRPGHIRTIAATMQLPQDSPSNGCARRCRGADRRRDCAGIQNLGRHMWMAVFSQKEEIGTVTHTHEESRFDRWRSRLRSAEWRRYGVTLLFGKLAGLTILFTVLTLFTAFTGG